MNILLDKEEVKYLLGYINDLQKKQIQKFLKDHDVPVTGTIPVLIDRLEEALREGNILYIDLVKYIDTIAPWDKQHVYLYKGPELSSKELDNWRSPSIFNQLMKKNNLLDCIAHPLPLVLPKRMKISSIEHSADRLRVFAVDRLESWQAAPDKDYIEIEDGQKIRYTASISFVTRGLLIFEWDLIANLAWLQVSQISSGNRTYEAAKKAFYPLVKEWITIENFEAMDLQRAISYFHTKEIEKSKETRAHKLTYRLSNGALLEGRSAIDHQPILDHQVANTALAEAQKDGTGHIGNLYFLSNPDNVHNPLSDELHVYLVASHNRVNFPTANSEEVLRYVLQRIQAACL